MTPGLLFLLLLAAPERANGCLPDGDGFLSMRLRGSIEAEVEWREPELDCTGMPRPDGRGLRLRFAGPLPGNGTLAIVIAAPELGMGASAHSVPVNVTLIDEAGEHIYGTQGEGRCMFDSVEQQLLPDAALPPRTYQVSARGFCTVPARAVDGDGAVLLTRFDFAGMVSYREGDDGIADLFPELPHSEVEVITSDGRHRFQVWIADTEQSREHGLMFVREMPANQGMLFLFEQPQFASFWMKNTYLPLDLVFIGPDGRVVNIAQNTVPLSLDPIVSVAPVRAVLELVAGTAARIGLAAGDRVAHAALAAPVAEG